jgi:non-ribosomal peptide synthetase component F
VQGLLVDTMLTWNSAASMDTGLLIRRTRLPIVCQLYKSATLPWGDAVLPWPHKFPTPQTYPCIMEARSHFNSMSGLSSRDQSLLYRFGSGPKLLVTHSTVHGAFESIVDAYPTTIAAVHGDKSITYQQLDLAANRLAHYLINSGLRPRQRVCLVVQRSLEMLIGILAILKTGCQYVPIDGGVASEQALKHMFEDKEARFILCLPDYWDRVRQFARRDAVVLELGMDAGAFYSPQRPQVQVLSNDGVYAMYTSG